MLKKPASKAAGSSATEAYPWGTLQGDVRLRTKLGGIFSILLGASIGRREGLLEDRPKAEVRDRIFEVGIQPLERAHVRVGDIFHREGDPFFPFAKRSHRMPELISIEDDQITRLRDELKMLGGFHRVILKQF